MNVWATATVGSSADIQPAEVDSSKVTATLKDGVLNIELPKAVHAKIVRVEPKTVS